MKTQVKTILITRFSRVTLRSAIISNLSQTKSTRLVTAVCTVESPWLLNSVNNRTHYEPKFNNNRK